MLNELHVMTESLAAVVPAEVGREFRSRSDNFDASPRSMELLHGSEFKEIRAICSETVKTFGRLFQATAHAELLRNAVRAHRRRLEEPVLHHYDDIPLRPLRKIAPSRSASSIPPHIPDDNHVYEQDPAAKLSATIVGWREVKSLTHYGVYVIEVACSDGRPPKLVYKRFSEFERLFTAYGKLVGNGKLRMPSTSTSSLPMSSNGSEGTNGSKSSSSNGSASKANKFDPDFHQQRAVELQPLLTGLCQRQDVFGCTKFMRWLYFEKQKDIPLLTIFDSAFQQTLDSYQIKSPVYANSMVDALTWLLFLRISHIWERLRKRMQYLAVKSVQDVILKAASPLDDMILQLNEMNLHFNNLLENQPHVLLRPLDTIDAKILKQFNQLMEKQLPSLDNFVSRLASDLTPHLVSVGASVKTKLHDLSRLVYNNIINDSDEPSITALVNGIEEVHRLSSHDLIPFFARILSSVVALGKSSLSSSPPLLASFSSISAIAPLLPRFVDLLLPPETALEVFLLMLKFRDAVEALDASLDEIILENILNDLETELERESDKIEHALALHARKLHGDLKRHDPTLCLLAPAIADALLKFGRLWAKWIRKFVQLAGDLLVIQRTGSYVTWSLAVRECISVAWSLSCEYLADHASIIAQKALRSVLVTLLEPVALSMVNELCFTERHSLESALQSMPFATPANPNATLYETLDACKHAALTTRSFFYDELRPLLDQRFFAPLSKAWSESPSATYVSELDQARLIKVAKIHERLMRDIQRLEMEEEMKLGELHSNLDRRGTMAGAMPIRLGVRNTRGTSGTPGSRKIPRPGGTGSQSQPFSPDPVARVIHRSSVSKPTQNGTTTTEKELDTAKLKKELTMLSRISADDQDAKAPQDASPALAVYFEVPKQASEPTPLSPQTAWARANASRSSFGASNRRMFYQVPYQPSSTPDSTPGSSYGASTDPQTSTGQKTTTSAGSARNMARKPSSNARPCRPSTTTSSTTSGTSTAGTTSAPRISVSAPHGTSASSTSTSAPNAQSSQSSSTAASTANTTPAQPIPVPSNSANTPIATPSTASPPAANRGWTPIVLPRSTVEPSAAATTSPSTTPPATSQPPPTSSLTLMNQEPATIKFGRPPAKK